MADTMFIQKFFVELYIHRSGDPGIGCFYTIWIPYLGIWIEVGNKLGKYLLQQAQKEDEFKSRQAKIVNEICCKKTMSQEDAEEYAFETSDSYRRLHRERLLVKRIIRKERKRVQRLAAEIFLCHEFIVLPGKKHQDERHET